jgi:5'-nucleotidase
MKKTHILITNDDGISAEGIQALTELLADNYRLTVVAPEYPQSGKSHSITTTRGLRLDKKEHFNGHMRYSVHGTPADCVKIALQCIMEDKPDIIVSGINDGTNTGNSAFYSGTVGAALEGAFFNIPSIAFSLCTERGKDKHFRNSDKYILELIEYVLAEFKKKSCCFNVNIPNIPTTKGIKICRQTKGAWKESFEKKIDDEGHESFWLKGNYINEEPDAKDTDEWAVSNEFIAVVPLTTDLTNNSNLERLKNSSLI